MAYFDSGLAQRLRAALTDLGIQSNDYPSLVRIYQMIQVLRRYLPPDQEMTSHAIKDLLNSESFILELASFGMYPLLPAQRDKAYIIYKLVCANGLDRDPVRFFRLAAPALIADWAGFLTKFTDHNLEKMLSAVYRISQLIHQASGTNAVFDINPEKVAADVLASEMLDDYDMGMLEECIRSALYVELSPLAHGLKENSGKKLRDVIGKIAARCDAYGNITAHDCILRYLSAGELTLDAALDKELKRLKKVQPSALISQFKPYTQQDDIIELRLVLMRFFEISKGELLIYNPSPTMLIEYPYLGGDLSRTIFVVPDALEAKVYQRQFPKYWIYAADALPKTFAGNILILDADGSLDLRQVLHDMTLYTDTRPQLLIYAPQMEMSSVNDYMAESGFYIDGIMGLPTGISRCAPAKKALIFGSTDYCEVVRIMQAERNIQTGRGKTGLPFLPVNALYLSRKYAEIPRQRLQENLTIQQMLNIQPAAEMDGRVKYQKPRTYAWSPEISILYTIYPRENGNYEGRAYIRSVSWIKGELRQGKRIGKLRTQGLRGKSVDEILQKLPAILFEHDLYNAYIPVLEKLCKDSPDGVSLKTMWYMLWADLQLLTSYDDAICHELFCCERQDLANIHPAQATVESILEALEIVCGIQGIRDAYLRQLCLIFKVAVDRKILAENKLKDVITRVRTQKTGMENLVSRLRKRTATDDQVKRILMVLMEKDGDFPRYATNSEYFFMAFSLFAAVPLVQLRALTWDDMLLTHDLCTIRISKKISRDGRILAINPPYYVPCSPIVMMLCEDRLNYLETRCGISAEAVKNEPLFWEHDPRRKSELKRKLEPITHATAKRIQNKMLAIAEIDTAFTQVTDGDKNRMLNLNDTYLRTFWHDNVVTQAAMRGLERGEVSYLLGKTPVDTVDAHYFGFAAPYNLMRMAAILHRWTAPYEALLRPSVGLPEKHVFHVDGNVDVHSCRDLEKCSWLLFEIIPESPEGSVQIDIDSQFGHFAFITKMGE